MMKKLIIGFLFLIMIFALSMCITNKPAIVINKPLKNNLPPVDREFRAAWVATVTNIDWPTAPGLSVNQQKKEAITILDSLTALNMNAVILQVRPQCDALYESSLEPWSYYLTGEQGKAPQPFYDPLKFWIEQAHKRGIELHAWFNPYRAHHPKGGEVGPFSVVKTHPQLVRKVQGGYHWLDPGMPETQDYSFNVVMDVVKRYDVDGIHFDDYFYPYGDGSFPDDVSWQAYLKRGGTLNRKDWRRDNVNQFIKRLYDAIKKEKNYVKFGISPFGIWRPGNPASIKGLDQYDRLYADSKLWLNKGWLDYWTPQLYWPINQIPQSFPVLLGWWANENKLNRHLWPGLYTSKAKNAKGLVENLSQVMITRGMLPDSPGQVHFSMKAFLRDTLGLNKALKNGPYKNRVLVPTSPWLKKIALQKPMVKTRAVNDSLYINWSCPNPDDIFHWVVYVKQDGNWQMFILNKDNRVFKMGLIRKSAKEKDARMVSKIAVRAVDRLGNLGVPEIVPIKKSKL